MKAVSDIWEWLSSLVRHNVQKSCRWKVFVRGINMQKKIQDYLAKPGKTIKEHAEDLLLQAEILWTLGYVRDEHIYFLLKEACLHHDDGKANPEFAMRVKGLKKYFDEEKEIAHNILSIYYLDPDAYPDEDYLAIACAILYHHNYCNEADVINEQKDLIQELLIDEYAYKLKRRHRKRLLGTFISNPQTIMVKGLLHRCDYSASGNYTVEYPNDFLIDALDEMMKRWQKKNPHNQWNELQRFCMQNRNNDVIVVASTGMGKTEAGLQWIGDKKGFFVLPIRTAINAIYDRIKDNILNCERLDERLALLHSEALEYYGSHTEEMDILEYHDRGKNLSLPLNISTMDQLFDFVFKYKGYEMKLVTLTYSKLVIDEIQMYGPDLLACLVYGIRQIHDLGGKIAIVTATLPPFIRDILINDAAISFKESHFTSDKVRHSVKVRESSMSVTDILACYNNNIESGRSNKILVVCNTIRKAQAIYEQLKEVDEELDLHIFHSRFTKADRKCLEEEIREFGVTYKEGTKILDEQNGIWISTSLVEVSLDIDFDYLFTELSELNALFQRMGRCNRKGAKEIIDYNCYVYCDGAEVKRGKKGFVDEVLYQCSKMALEQVDGLLSESEKLRLIDHCFTTERVRQSEFMKEYKRIFTRLCELRVGEYGEKEEVQLRTISTQDIVPKPVYDEYKELISELESRLWEIEKEIRQGVTEKSGHEAFRKLYNERMDVRERLKSYIVSIPRYEYKNYVKKVWISYGKIRISRYENVPIMDCIYDEKGYRPLNYNDKTIQDEIMLL